MCMVEWNTTWRRDTQVAARHVARIATRMLYFVNKRSCPLLQADKYATRHEESSTSTKSEGEDAL